MNENDGNILSWCIFVCNYSNKQQFHWTVRWKDSEVVYMIRKAPQKWLRNGKNASVLHETLLCHRSGSEEFTSWDCLMPADFFSASSNPVHSQCSMACPRSWLEVDSFAGVGHVLAFVAFPGVFTQLHCCGRPADPFISAADLSTFKRLCYPGSILRLISAVLGIKMN